MRAIIVSGFCDSGKTTFINYLANIMKPWSIVVLQNEFGNVELNEDIPKVEVFSCACCSVPKEDFIKYIKDIQDKYNPDVLIIEASYTSSPAVLKELLLSTELVEDNIVSYHVADVCNFISHWKSLGDMYRAQVRESDIVVFAKYNLLEDKSKYPKVKDYLNEIIYNEDLNITVHDMRDYIK